jgi:hypothetical protein
MSKYDALGPYLKRQNSALVPMTFRDIERVTGAKLPNSKRYPAWWSNNTWNNVMTKVWLDAGFRTEQVDTPHEKLVFRRTTGTAFQEGARPYQGEAAPHPIRGALKDTFTVEPAWDLTRPSLEEGAFDIEKTAGLIDAGMRGPK